MTRAWIGTSLLAGSWLLGLGYFQPANPAAWICALAVAIVLLADIPVRWPDRRQGIAAVLLLLPAVWWMPLPYKSIPVLFSLGLIVQLTPIPRRWPRKLGQGAAVAASILLVQSFVLHIYSLLTARSHELPSLLTRLVGFVPRLLGLDATVDGSTIAMRSAQDMYRFAATWELLADPATVCLLAGGLVLLGFISWGSVTCDERWKNWRNRSLILFAVVLAWLPVRIGLMLGIILHRALRADAITAPNVADVLVNSWVHIALLAGPVFLVIRWIGRIPKTNHADAATEPEQRPIADKAFRTVCGPLMFGLGIAVLVCLWHWDPVGKPKSGRVMVVERHSTWEPTTEPYRTTVYGEAGSYNYAAAFEYCGQSFDMSRLLESEAINDEMLDRCDVLVIKTPTARYSETEAAAVVRFVEQGGSLLMIGDHTNVFNMNTYLNDISRKFGFTFRNDLLFRVGSPYEQKYFPPLLAHPVVQHVPPMNFAVSCSIDPGHSLGRMVIRNTGLWNLPPAYHESNYHPQAEYRSLMQYGAWCQLWSTRHGSGRVLAFADSTLFSNFCVFQPGKAELLVGMLQWLNHRSVFDRLWIRVLILLPIGLIGLGLVAGGFWYSRRQHINGLLLAAAAIAGWTLAAVVLVLLNRSAMPQPVIQRPMVHVVIDRTVSDVPLFTGAFADDKQGLGYGMLEQWIPRIGVSISRRTGKEAFCGDGLVILCPTRSISQSYREQLIRFVESGGHVVVFDSPDVQGSTANSLLWPFGLGANHRVTPREDGELRLKDSELKVPLRASCEITGGEPLAWLGDAPAVALAQHGKGTVTAVGFASLFNDAAMGHHWLPEPDPDVLNRYEALYTLLRAALPHQ